jgi:hypothetical protein
VGERRLRLEAVYPGDLADQLAGGQPGDARNLQ